MKNPLIKRLPRELKGEIGKYITIGVIAVSAVILTVGVYRALGEGIALARAASLRGARVTLVAANVSLPLPSGCTVRTVRSTAELAEAMLELQADADAIVMAAAPADFTPEAPADGKIKKDGDGGLTVSFKQTTDVLKSLLIGSAWFMVIVCLAV